jgi:cobalamin-dependent methionine synthase I
MKSFGDIATSLKVKKDQRNAYEYQAYGNRLADELADPSHRSLYIKLAKSTDRNLLETARLFALSNEKNSTKGKIFMWKLGELKKATKK